MKQEIYNTYKISVDGSDGKFVITSIENENGDKLESKNKNQEFKSEDDAIDAAKKEIDTNKDNNNNKQINESEFDKLFNKIILEYNLQNDWKKVIKEDSEMSQIQDFNDNGYDTDPEITYEDDEEITISTLIEKFNATESKDEKKVIIDDIKKNNSNLLNDFIKKLQDINNNPSEDMNDEDIQNIQELIEYAEK